ncbi:mannose-1-phosphate guanylyltransferase/mannose-6-phosphate isomerase [Thermovibrio sp.]
MKVGILAGGAGTRLFPLSREKYPKQFIKLFSEESLFQSTLKRASFISDGDGIFVLTSKNYKFMVLDQAEEVGFKLNHKRNIVLEPCRRNTAPALALFVRHLLELGVPEEESVIVMPSDHFIKPDGAFKQLKEEIEALTSKGFILTFGIKPTKPETGYGYIEVGEEISGKGYKVKRFVEKPSVEKALEYLSAGNYLWNAGIFAFTLKTFKEELKKHSPEIYEVVFALPTIEDVVKSFDTLPDISVDYALMEKTDRAAVIPCDFTWSDVGSWDSVYELFPKDEGGNVLKGKVLVRKSKDSLIFNADEDQGRLIVGLGVDDLLIVGTKDVTLVAKRGMSQEVKSLVKELKSSKELKDFVESHLTEYRPWGSFTELGRGERYKIKRLTVKPGGKLSYQMHYHRSEHWVVVRGTAKVILDGKEYFVHENESIFIPKTTPHRLENPGKIPLEVIEVQVGEYLGEDDIVRFKDDYGRN